MARSCRLSSTTVAVALTVLIVPGAAACSTASGESESCNNGGICAVRSGATLATCACNKAWAGNTPTWAGAQCDQSTVECGMGIWCYNNGAKCSMRNMVWAHGDDSKRCREAGGTCILGASTSAGHTQVYLCVGGTLDGQGVMCNSATGCHCADGWIGTHCDNQIVVCKRSQFGSIIHYCNARTSIGCASETKCSCLSGFTGDHCEIDDGTGTGAPTSAPPTTLGPTESQASALDCGSNTQWDETRKKCVGTAASSEPLMADRIVATVLIVGACIIVATFAVAAAAALFATYAWHKRKRLAVEIEAEDAARTRAQELSTYLVEAEIMPPEVEAAATTPWATATSAIPVPDGINAHRVSETASSIADALERAEGSVVQ